MNILHHFLTPQIAAPESRKYLRYPLSIDIPNLNPVQASMGNQLTSTAEDNIDVEELLEFRDFGISDPPYYLPSTELFKPNEISIGDAPLPSLMILETGGFLPYHFPVLKAPSQALNDYYPVDTQRPVQPVPVCTTSPSLKVALPQNRGAKRNETARKPFKCSSCGSRYKQKQGLNRHKSDNHKAKKRCDLCPDFMWPGGRRYMYKEHVREEHGPLYHHIFN
ncbi:hypothetical protein B0F90DRAFT_1920958 [Multifurca ochricompacta]|uniref:C2H2-type domain-containing protein n=1 Tax=Multifurca ochricompacta TaxID=376703 RepID=A0AAD4LTV6_9AGAM|nr:hypothetical protein B0F90DRAFT_1920958 [Multifurca ochricompacta]